MPVAPTGIVTLVFTDIQGSTELWEHLGDAFKPLLDHHNRLFRAAIVEFGGYEVKTEGDSFMVAFPEPDPAVRMCLALQMRLHRSEWSDILRDSALDAFCGFSEDGTWSGLRVRMGVHTGKVDSQPDPVTGRMDYFGRMVNRAARIASVGHGGQILLSEATRKALTEPLEDSKSVDLGPHALRGLERREVLTQILPTELSERHFPRLRTPDLRKTNLPTRLDTFFGREPELRELSQRIEKDQRLVTLVGAGGTGKTRLSQRFGAQNLARFPGGVWFCDLCDETDEAGVLSVVARAMEVPLSGPGAVTVVGNALRGRGRALIILDNFEQVVDSATPLLSQWIQEAPEAFFLVTSRLRLGIEGEALFYLDPLPTTEAVQLFVDRARSVQPSFSLTDANTPVVTEIVERLDCMSLAIELAASRTRLVPVDGILKRLSKRFELLRGRQRDQAARQATLRGAIDWSWELLQPWEQLALAQCAVFHRGFTLEAAEEVIDLSHFSDAPWTLDVIEALVDHSLLRMVEPREGHQRLRIFDSIRDYAAERLEQEDAIGTGPEARKATLLRHAIYFSQFWSLDGQSRSPDRKRLEARWILLFELENLVAGAEEALSLGAIEPAAFCALAAGEFFGQNAPPDVGARLMARLIQATTAHPRIQAHLFDRSSRLLRAQGRSTEATAHCAEGLVLAREVRDRRLEARLLRQSGYLARERGDPTRSRSELEAALQIAQEAGAWNTFAQALNTLAGLCAEQGQLLEAKSHFERCHTLAREHDLVDLQVVTLLNLGNLMSDLGDNSRAVEILEDARQLVRSTGNRRAEVGILGTLAIQYGALNRVEESSQHFEIAAEMAREVGHRSYHAFLQGNWGIFLSKIGEQDRARQKLEAAIEACDEMWPAGAGSFRGDLACIRAQQGDLDEARTLLARGEAQLQGINTPGLGMLYLRWAEVEHIAGEAEACAKALSQAQRIESQLSMDGTSDLSQSIEKARARFEQG